MTVSLQVLEDPIAACAQLLTERAHAGGKLVLAGGSTPRAVYERAAAQADAWACATVWFGDERCVPTNDERSNFAMVKAALLDRLPEDRRPEVHRIRGELGPATAADAYEDELRAAAVPPFDLVLLGLGPDGHTASLFPDQPSLSERELLVVGVEQAGLEPFVPRVSMTFPALAGGRRIVYLVQGESKADAVAAAFGRDAASDTHVPSSLWQKLAAEVVVLLDNAAARKVRP